MNYLKFTPYLYLVVAVIMVVNGCIELNSGTDKVYLSFFMAAMALAMFFFRRKFANKINNKNNNQ